MEHDLIISEPIIKKMARDKAKISTIYKLLRSQARFQFIGDYPMISWIVRTVSMIREITKIEIVKTLRIAVDGEFKRINSRNEIVTQLYAQVAGENGRETGQKLRVDPIASISIPSDFL